MNLHDGHVTILEESRKGRFSLLQNDVTISTEKALQAKAKPAARQGMLAARSAKKAGPVILILCLVIAILAVLLIPVFVNGNTPASRGAMRLAAVQHDVAEYQNLSDAVAKAGFTPSLPTALPEGTKLVAIRTLDSSVLEMEYRINSQVLVLRTAPGNGDLSDTAADYPFIANEDAAGVTRSYMGSSASQFNLAMWADNGYSYALVAPSGMDAVVVRQVAESIE